MRNFSIDLIWAKIQIAITCTSQQKLDRTSAKTKN